MTRVLVLGRGILGTALEGALAARSLPAVVLPHASCDVRRPADVRAAIDAHRPDLLVNAAAYTKVDDCEEERETAFAVNGVAPGMLARLARAAGIRLVHVSTDFVFSGRGREEGPPYTEDDAPDPVSVYGQSKRVGELEVAREGGPGGGWLVVRTSWHYGPGGPNFVRTIHERAAAGGPLSVVSDQRGRPTYSGHLAAAILELSHAGAQGIVHYADGVASGSLSWHDFARAIVEGSASESPVAAIASESLRRPARRPAYSALDTGRYERLVGHAPPDWRAGLAAYLGTLAARPVAAAPPSRN